MKTTAMPKKLYNDTRKSRKLTEYMEEESPGANATNPRDKDKEQSQALIVGNDRS